MHLVMFDIDGTLTETFAIDGKCYVQAVAEVSGLGPIHSDWAAYRHTTDSGILHEVYESHLRRPPEPDEVLAVQDRFFALLERAASAAEDAFAPIPGAQNFIEDLLASGYAVSLATGGWQISARLKLASAGLRVEKLPAAFADDALSRSAIMQESYRRACEVHGLDAFSSVTYFGDGTWDAKASRLLAYRFIGIGSGERSTLLRQLGAAEVFPDYGDIIQIKKALAKTK